MAKKIRDKMLTAVIFAALAFGSMQFVEWISRMAFENTCIELQEQYIAAEAAEKISTIENAVDFGKELKNYYGMDGILEEICGISEGDLKAAVLDSSGDLLYLSFGKSGGNTELLAQIYSEKYQKEIAKVTERNSAGERVSLGERESIVFPVYKGKTELAGRFLVIYRQKELVRDKEYSSIDRVKWMILGIVSAALFLFYFFGKDSRQEQGFLRHIPVLMVMAAMLANILFMYQVYQEKYSVMVKQNAESAAASIQSSVEDLLEKGLPITRINEVSDYLEQKAEGNAAMESIAVVQSYYNTGRTGEEKDSSVLKLDLADGLAQLEVVVSKSYISDKVFMMFLTFGAVFIVCLMITYELTHLAEILSVRMDKEFPQDTGRQFAAVSRQIKLISFLAYTAIYTSMSYTAVIMRNQDASLFGLSKAVSASLPLTVELFCIMLSSVAAQKLCKDMKLNHLLVLVFAFLISGNMACMLTTSPYILLGLRAFCGAGFGLLKYWLNSIVSAGSENPDAVGKNYAQLNAGLLGGITAGASLGAILAQSMGYSFNYFFTGVLCSILLFFCLLILPWKMFQARREKAACQSEGQQVRMIEILRNREFLKVILFGGIPLNIGLMYVVAFLPVYMDNIGQPAVAAGYAYLVNGLAGVYLGVAMMGMLKKLSKKLSCAIALLLGAVGILVLVVGSDVGIALLSAGIMGLFDGYGTPAVTGFFTSLPAVQKADTASMLTVFNSVGSAVQILCPVLYNMLIRPDGGTGYLFLFGCCYAAVAVLFLFLFPQKKMQ